MSTGWQSLDLSLSIRLPSVQNILTLNNVAFFLVTTEKKFIFPQTWSNSFLITSGFYKAPFTPKRCPVLKTFNKEYFLLSLNHWPSCSVIICCELWPDWDLGLMWYWDGNSAGTEPGVTSDHPPEDPPPFPRSKHAREAENRSNNGPGQNSNFILRNQTVTFYFQSVSIFIRKAIFRKVNALIQLYYFICM